MFEANIINPLAHVEKGGIETNKGVSPSQILSNLWRLTLCLSTRAMLSQIKMLFLPDLCVHLSSVKTQNLQNVAY